MARSWVTATSVLFFPLLPPLDLDLGKSACLRGIRACSGTGPGGGVGQRGTWGVISLGSLHVWEVTGRGLAASHVWPLPSSLCPCPSFVHSLDLSELAKAAKKKLQAVSLRRQGPASLTLCSCDFPAL